MDLEGDKAAEAEESEQLLGGGAVPSILIRKLSEIEMAEQPGQDREEPLGGAAE